MSTHPNVILMAVLRPDDLSRKTCRLIKEKHKVSDKFIDENRIAVGSSSYKIIVMEDDYDDSSQISAAEGDIVLFIFVTYGYGEYLTWSDLEALKNELEAFVKKLCKEVKCSYEIRVSANYW